MMKTTSQSGRPVQCMHNGRRHLSIREDIDFPVSSFKFSCIALSRVSAMCAYEPGFVMRNVYLLNK